MSSQSLIPAFSPDGKSVFVTSPEGRAAMIPTDNLGDAIQNNGFKVGVPSDIYTKYLSQKQAIPGVHVTSPEGRDAVLPSTQVHEALTQHGFKLGTSNQQTLGQPEEPGMWSKLYDWSTKGLISGKDLFNYAANKVANQHLIPTGQFNETGMAPETQKDYYTAAKEYAASGATPTDIALGDSPVVTGLRHGLAGALTDTADTASPLLTSPVTLATAGVAEAPRILEAGGEAIPALKRAVPAVKTLVRAGQGAAGVGFGVQGAENIHQAATDTSKTVPERLQEGLQGASMLAGGAAGAGEAGVGRIPGQLASGTADLALKGADLVKQGTQAVRLARNPVAAAETLPADTLAIKATKPRNSINDIRPQVQSALQDARRAADNMGIQVKTLDDAQNAVTQAKKDVWNEYQQRLGPHETFQIDGNNVADAMESTISKRFESQNPVGAKAIRELADTYRRPLSLAEAEDFLQSANDELSAHYAKTKVSRRVAARDPSTAPTVAEANALRQEIYGKLDELTGPGAADLKRRYGSLVTLEDVLQRRINVAERQAPESLIEQIGKVEAAKGIGKGVVKAVTGRPLAGAADVYGAYQGLKAARAARQANDANFLISKAFEKTSPRPPAVPVPRPPIAGLLNPGPIELGASQEPINPGPEGVLPAARTTVIDPRTGQPRTQFLTSVAKPQSPIQQMFAGTAQGAANDTALFQQARQELGPDASISDVAKRAQQLKTQPPKITSAPPSNNSPYDVRSLIRGESDRRAIAREPNARVWTNAERIIRQAGFETIPDVTVNKELGTITFWDAANPNRPAIMKIQDVEQGGPEAVKQVMADRMGQQEAKASKGQKQTTSPEPSSPVADLLSGKSGKMEGVKAEKGAGPSPSATPQGQQAAVQFVYHGTNAHGAAELLRNGIKSRPFPSIYVTDTPERAARYANAQATGNVDPSATELGKNGSVIVEFERSGNNPIEWQERKSPESLDEKESLENAKNLKVTRVLYSPNEYTAQQYDAGERGTSPLSGLTDHGYLVEHPSVKVGQKFSETTSRPQSGGTSPVQDLLSGKSRRVKLNKRK